MVVGGGGREHAIIKKIKESALVEKIYALPGNGGIAEDAECVDIDTLCRESDIISIHCPLNDESRNLINEQKLSLMKPNVILVNEARGAVLDEEAVVRAVKEGKIAGFGCDVYSSEPFRENHPYYAIRNLPNVILTPHMAWGAYESRCRCLSEIIENIKTFFDGGIRNRVDLI